jgi:hypothetical protein
VPNPTFDEVAAIFYAIKDFSLLAVLGHYRDFVGVLIHAKQGVLN